MLPRNNNNHIPNLRNILPTTIPNKRSKPNMRIIYQPTHDCNDCLYNTGTYCKKLGKYLKDICFERDCPLPILSDVEQYTHYIDKNKNTQVCGNCKHWTYKGYDKYFNKDIGQCTRHKSCRPCTTPTCKDYKEVQT